MVSEMSFAESLYVLDVDVSGGSTSDHGSVGGEAVSSGRRCSANW
jgi:hypothetical protein